MKKKKNSHVVHMSGSNERPRSASLVSTHSQGMGGVGSLLPTLHPHSSMGGALIPEGNAGRPCGSVRQGNSS